MPRRLTTGRASISGVALTLALLTALLVGTPAAAAGGTLAGTLRGPDGTPFSYFKVSVFEADGAGAWRPAIPPVTVPPDTFTFSIPLPAGTYRACFAPAGDLEWAESAGTRCWRSGLDVQSATDLVVTDGATTTIHPVLPREARVRGRITDTTGAGVVAYVSPYRRAPDGSWQPVYGGDQSSPDGRYEITDLDPGTYRFCLPRADLPAQYLTECFHDAATVGDAQDVAVPPGSAPIVDFQVSPRASIAGEVARPAGSTEPVSVIAYRSHQDRWEAAAWAGVDQQGEYRITGLDAGTYRLCAYGYDVVTSCWEQGSQPSTATDIPLATGEARTGIDLAPGAAGYVQGTLPEVYLGAEGWPYVTAYRRVDGQWEAVSAADAVPAPFGNDWTYTIGSLPTDSYVVCAHHEQPELGINQFPHTCTGDSPTPQGGVPVEVVAGATTSGVDIVTGQAGEIRGRVNGASGPVRVELFTATGRLALSRTTLPDGSYRFRELPSGSYRVAFHRATVASPLAAEYWRNVQDGAGLGGATVVPVDADITFGISATLDTGGTIFGRLVDDLGAPVAGCRVQARGRDGDLAARNAVTAPDGWFAIRGLSTAAYLVLVPRTCTGGAAGLYYDAGSPSYTTARLRDADEVPVVRGTSVTLAGDLRGGVQPPP